MNPILKTILKHIITLGIPILRKKWKENAPARAKRREARKARRAERRAARKARRAK